MKNFTSKEIRNIWLKYFESKNHIIMPSSSLIPIEDDSLLWINSGVAPIKKYFDGSLTPPSKRITNYQKAIRTGDIDNVGITTRHHTFFEMLGNFSIGDYFKKEAIEFSWELLTSKKYFGINKNLLYITIYKEDFLSKKIWKEIGISSKNLFLMDKNTNFWDMGKGPCGPSSEIFFDKGEKYDSRNASYLIQKDIENDRFIEIWNIVFSEFNNIGNGNYKKLPKQNIDTGAGIERLASVLQNKPSNFETDLFENIIKKIETKSKFNYLWEYIPSILFKENKHQFNINSWYKKISDYMRTVCFAIADGSKPDNSGRGYIIRRLLRKSIINSNRLGIKENFLHELVDPIIEIMGDFYPNLKSKRKIIIETIINEENQFKKTLLLSINKLEEKIKTNTLDEESAHKLHETFGLPLDLLRDITEYKKNINLDWEKINKIENEFRLKSKSKNNIDAMKIQDDKFVGFGKTTFTGYESLKEISKVMYKNGDYVIFDKTPFYAKSGGQESDFGKAGKFYVKSVKKNSEKTFIHKIPNNNFKIGQKVILTVDEKRRKGLTIHHTSHHLISHSFNKIMDEIMPQSSFKAEEDYIRFGFSTQKKIDDNIVKKAQDLANKWISEKRNVLKEEIPFEEAKKRGALFLQGSDYDELVRIVTIEGLVSDMCGGTHVDNINEIEQVLITKFEKKGSGNWVFEMISGNDNISEKIFNINKNLNKDILEPFLKKINNLNEKLNFLNINKKINFKNDLNKLDINDFSYNKNLNKLISKINLEISLLNNEIFKKFQKNILNLKNNFYFFETEIFNLQEISKPILSVINNTNLNIVVLQIKNKEKVSVCFILNKKNVNEKNIKKIKLIADEYKLKGNGNRQQYIFGGKKINFKLMIKEIEKWEF